MHSIILSGFSLALGALAGSWVRTWQMRGDHLISRLDEMADEVVSLRSLIQTYWLKDRPDAHSAPHEELQVEIFGRFLWLNDNFSGVEEKIPDNTRQKIRNKIDDYLENATGGNFGDSEGAKDLVRVQATYRTGAALVREIKNASLERLTFLFLENARNAFKRNKACF